MLSRQLVLSLRWVHRVYSRQQQVRKQRSIGEKQSKKDEAHGFSPCSIAACGFARILLTLPIQPLMSSETSAEDGSCALGSCPLGLLEDIVKIGQAAVYIRWLIIDVTFRGVMAG